jgi:mannose PTS system EIIA component
MNKILLIAHAPLASALRQCVLHVFPELAWDVVALDVVAQTNPEETYDLALAMVNQLDAGGQYPVMILTDVFGATPCNVAQRLVTGSNRRLVAGVNLPMLLRAATYRLEPIESMVSKSLAGGMQGVMPVAVTAPQNQVRQTDAYKHHHDQQ